MLLSLVLLTGCQSGSVSEDAYTDKEEVGAVYRKITPEEAKEMMAEEGVLILDVREKSEFDEGYIEGALLLPVGNINSGDLSLIPDKDQKLLIYCRSGNRSGIAAKKLVEYGYTQVYDFGGINDWPDKLVK